LADIIEEKLDLLFVIAINFLPIGLAAILIGSTGSWIGDGAATTA
jgi:hypothetical protein